MNEVYVLQIRFSGEEDEVFLFRYLRDARAKVYDFFEEQPPQTITSKTIDTLEERYFTQEKGYFSIYTATIH